MTRTSAVLAKLRAYESRNVTFIDPDGSWPVVWERARGVHVWDAEGRKYLDLTAAFGVAAAGHANPRVVAAGQRQMGRLLHAMGDVHPHALKAELAATLSRITFERWAREKSEVRSAKSEVAAGATAKTIFCNSGFEAVEAALKTALLATGRRGIIAFKGAYHGLGYGALNATHREHFREPFKSQLGEFGFFADFPSASGSQCFPKSAVPELSQRAERRPPARRELGAGPSVNSPGRRPALQPLQEATEDIARLEISLRKFFRRQPIGAILVEPVQARGGINIPPPEFLPLLRRLCDEHGALLILDEIYTGFGRTGKWFACEHSGVRPDVLCLGKALTGGFPLSACVGRTEVMDAAWPASQGEAIHTSTFLGHPVGCAMALAQIAEIERLGLPERSAELGGALLSQLTAARSGKPDIVCAARGVGLMAGLELLRSDGLPATDVALRAIKTLLAEGFILLPEGEHANVVSFTPPLTITARQLSVAVDRLVAALG